MLITNARIFDGEHESLATGMSVLVEGDKIARIAPAIPPPAGATVIDGRQGAYADLLLVDGNPLENLDLVADPDKNFVVIIKDGTVYKNTTK